MALSGKSRVFFLAVLLCFSGGCALVYQMVWLREFRLIFGGATPATAAVLAVFMGGLGLGSIGFGRRAERTTEVLRLYGWLELAVSLTALLTPWVLQLVRYLYIQTGGVVALGPMGSVLLHLLLAVLVLGVPCALMGGTLPLAVKYVETDEDSQRGSAGLLYGLNALGALAGVGLSTFWLLERLGTRGTLYLAAGINTGIALAALWVAWWENSKPVAQRVAANRSPLTPTRAGAEASTLPPLAPALYVYGAAFVTGFVFFLVELVWYRMAAPLLGSSTYSFGIILALALAGIGAGGLAYRIGLAPRVGASSLGVFGLVAALQAFWLVLPYAFGDRVAIVAFYANQLRSFGFGGQVVGWTLIGAMLVLAPSFLAGVQFPLLVSLLGRGRTAVGRQLGHAYAWNTAGAIAGSLLAGFVLIPHLTAPGCWRLGTWLTLGLSATALALALRRVSPRLLWPTAVVGLAGLWMSLATLGPTAAWRHTAIGYGRVHSLPTSPNKMREWVHLNRWRMRHEFDGREASVAINSSDGYAFYVNGKSDGSAIGDAPTQVMLGLVSAVLHPQPHRACVVGLGTGSSAGWLAEVPGMERVDVVEIEPRMRELARDYFKPVNRDVLQKPNVRMILGDARETLLVHGAPYDLIVSEPSNPYRAGVASLYTREFYEAVKRRLNPGGIFSQWVQGYEIDARSVRLVYATLAAVFPHVETWITAPNDLLFVCHLAPPAYSLEHLRKKVAGPPFDEALRRVWFTDSAEGFLARHFASPALAQEVARQEGRVNTDNLNWLEYGFARALVQDDLFSVNDILKTAILRQIDRPAHLRDRIDAARLLDERMLLFAAQDWPFAVPTDLEGDAKSRAAAIAAYVDGDYAGVMRLWRGEASSPMARLILVEAVSQVGTPEQARPMLDWVREGWPIDARFAAARLASRYGSETGAVEHLQVALTTYRADPWVRPKVAERGLALTRELGKSQPKSAATLFGLVSQPFCVTAQDRERLEAMVDLARQLGPAQQVTAADAWGPYPPWTRAYLEFRRNAYVAAHDPRAAQAQSELDQFIASSGRTFVETILQPPRPAP